jgi:hypothetical protein
MRLFFCTLIIVATAFAQDTGIPGLAAKLGRQLASRKLKSVAVLQFTNTQNFDRQLSAQLVDQVIREMGTQAKGIEVASQTQGDALLRELRLADAPEISTKDLQTIATRLSVDAIVTGTFNAAGQTIAIDTTIFDGKSSYIIGAASAKLSRTDFDTFLVERKGLSAAGVGIPSGMQIDVKLNEKVDAAEARNGKTISATLDNDVVARNVLVAKKGAEVKLQATSPDGMELHITLDSMTLADQRNVHLSSDQIIRPSTMIRPKDETGGVPENAPLRPKPGDFALGAQLAFHLNQDVR